MMLTTYALEFQPPHARSQDDNINYYLKRKGRRHFNALKAQLPVLKDVETEQKQEERHSGDAEKRKLEMDKKYMDFLVRTEWSPISLMGRIVRPAMLPANMTKEEEAQLRKLYDQSFTSNQRRKRTKDQETQTEELEVKLFTSKEPKRSAAKEEPIFSEYLFYRKHVDDECGVKC